MENHQTLTFHKAWKPAVMIGTLILPQTVLALWGSGALKACQGFSGLLGVPFTKNVARTLDISTSAKNNVAVAAVRWSLDPRRCSDSNFIFAKPYKTNGILILLWSISRFPYQNQWKINNLAPQNDPQPPQPQPWQPQPWQPQSE